VRPSNKKSAWHSAREAELERISAQAEMGTQEGREKRTRDIAAKRSAERRAEFQKRAASVNPWADPGETILVQNSRRSSWRR